MDALRLTLKAALGIAALSVTRSRDTYFAAKYRRICARRGPMKALVAVERAMVVAAHGMLTNGEFYRDLGANYVAKRRRDQHAHNSALAARFLARFECRRQSSEPTG